MFHPERESAQPTVADVVSAYLEHRDALCAAGLLGAHSHRNTRTYCNHFAEDFGERPVAECRKHDLIKWLALRPAYKSPHTLQCAVGVILQCFRWAADEGLIPSCPFTRPKDLPTPQPRQPITEAEVRAVLAAARRGGRRRSRLRFRAALWFLWETGIRTCELFELRWEQYDPVRRVFEMDSKTTRRTGQTRLIALGRRAARMIALLRRQLASATGYIFLNSQGGPWRTEHFGRMFRHYARAAGVRPEVSAYSCRHGFTCEALESGSGERQIADYLGHTTTKYVHWYGRGVSKRVDYLRDVADKRRKR